MIRLAICDDNALQREILRDILMDYCDNRGVELHIGDFGGGKELLDCVRAEGFFDIYILDLIMPGINGMETASTLRIMKDPGRIIFLTSTLEYAVASYEVEAMYYMLKPVDLPKLYHLLDRAISGIISDASTIDVKTHSGRVKIKLDDLMFVDVNNRALRYHLKDGRVVSGLVIRTPFKQAVEHITVDSRFVMCGVSMVVNLGMIDQLDSESLLFADGTVVYPPKAACTALKRLWKDRISGLA